MRSDFQSLRERMDPNVVIDRLGGTSKTAELFEITPASVSGWRKKGIPKPRLQFLRLARPDVLAEPARGALGGQT